MRRYSCQFVADGMDVVVAWGGDGTINQAAGRSSDRQPHWHRPRWIGNGLARGLGLRGTAEQSFRSALTAPPCQSTSAFSRNGTS
jgi:diacylglycerol kinase family enzyme